MLSALERVTAARIQVLQSSPFYGLAAMRFELVDDPDCRDMWTNGDQVGFNPKWVGEAKFDLLKTVVAKLAHHVAA